MKISAIQNNVRFSGLFDKLPEDKRIEAAKEECNNAYKRIASSVGIGAVSGSLTAGIMHLLGKTPKLGISFVTGLLIGSLTYSTMLINDTINRIKKYSS